MPRSKFDFAYEARVRYADIDMQGVMFNAAYLAYFDTAITEFFRSRSFDFAQRARESGIDFHVVRALVEYKQPITHDMQIEICVRIARIGSSSITFLLEIHATGAEQLMTQGEIVYVHTDQKTHRPVPVTEELRRTLLGEGAG